MARDGPMAMPTDQEVLTLTQWFSPGFPVGSFAYSHGLEWAIETEKVRDAETARDWISATMVHGAGRNDCVFIGAAYRARNAMEVDDIDATCRAFAASRERLKEADLQGAAFCAATSAIWSTRVRGLVYPVAVGRAANLQNLPLRLTAQMYLHSFLANLAAVAMRLVPLGQTEGQRLIHALMPQTAEIASHAVETGLDSLSATALASDIASMKHETQYSRIFRT